MSAPPRGLLLSRSLPWPPSIGTQQRTNLFYRALRRLAQVDTLVISRFSHPEQGDLPVLERDFGFLGRMSPRWPTERWPWSSLERVAPRTARRAAYRLAGPGFELAYDRRVARRVERELRARRYDFVAGRYLDPLAISGAHWSVPVLVDVDDFRSDVAESRREGPHQGAGGSRAVSTIRKIEHDLCARCAHVFVAKPADLSSVGHARASVLPNVPFVPAGGSIPPACPADDRSQAILFVGSFRFGVNVRAVDHFVDAVWPAILEGAPQARLRLVGPGMAPDQEKRWGSVPGVEVVGFVDALEDAYASCAFSICPIVEGGGSKIKVLESLLYGRTCVVSPHSLRGYETHLRDGEALCVAPDDASMARACITLLGNPRARRDLAAQGRRQVLGHYSVDRFESVVGEALGRALERTPS